MDIANKLSKILSDLLLRKEPLLVAGADVFKLSVNSSSIVRSIAEDQFEDLLDVTVNVGVSGGADSTCLLVLLTLLSRFLPLKVNAAHVAYGLRGAESEKEIVFLKELCKSLSLPLEVYYPDSKEQETLLTGNLQATARNIRMRFFARLTADIIEDNSKTGDKNDSIGNVKRDSIVALAHTLNDNSETFLLRLLAGSGASGLSAMSNYSKMSIDNRELIIMRPLLESSRESIIHWLKLNSIDWCEDSSNATDKYKRNKVRHDVISILNKVEPKAVKLINQSRALIKIDNDFIEQQSNRDFERIIRKEYWGGSSFASKDLLKLHKAISSRIIRRMVMETRIDDTFTCSHFLLAEILHMAKYGKSGDNSSLRKHLHISLFNDRIYCFPLIKGNQGTDIHNREFEICWDTDRGNFECSVSCWKIKCSIHSSIPEFHKINRCYEGLEYSSFKYVGSLTNDDNGLLKKGEKNSLIIRNLRADDKIAIKGGKFKKAKKILQEKSVPSFLRNLWPVMLYGSDQLLWVCGFNISSLLTKLDKTSNQFIVVEIFPM